MTPKPTLSLEDLKNKALAVNPKKYLTQEHQDYADAVNPTIVLDLIERFENLEKEFLFLMDSYAGAIRSSYHTIGKEYLANDAIARDRVIERAKHAIKTWGTK